MKIYGRPMTTWKIPESVLVVIYNEQLEVLLLERADAPGFWQSVTGSKDTPDEPWSVTACREVWEETGVDVRDARVCLQDWQLENTYTIYPQWLHRYEPGVLYNTERVFGLRVPAGARVRLSPREHVAYQWLPWVEAADRCYSPSNAEAVLWLPRLARQACLAPPPWHDGPS